MKVLIACEFSGHVREEFRKLGHDAWSCDLLPTEIAGQHIQGDVRPFLDMDWDLIIAHPPCTDLAVSGAKHFARKIADGSQQRSIDFFLDFTEVKCPRVCIENPIGIMSTIYRKPDQIIHPWQFGDEFEKTTCLWLKGLPKLIPTDIVDKGEFVTLKSGKKLPKWYSNAPKPKDGLPRGLYRSRTSFGIAKAMAEQWSKLDGN
jgi:hypothetical protein